MKSEELLRKRISERMVKAMATFSMLNNGDHVLVALSGGKDSLCLLEMLARRASVFHPRFEVEAVHVRMENVNYETSTIYLEEFCNNLGVKLHILTTRFDDGSGNTTYNSAQDRRRQKSPCFLCSWYRRKVIFNLAQQLNCNKIALGHHQDDLMLTALMNLTFQSRFETMPPVLKLNKMPLTLIRPLCLVAEEDIKQYAKESGYEQQVKLCTYEHDSHRTDISRLYDTMQSLNPEARHSLWGAVEKTFMNDNTN